jgi:hypothetical protein
MSRTDSDIDRLIDEFLSEYGFPDHSDLVAAKSELKQIIEEVRTEAYEEGYSDGFDRGCDPGEDH